IVGVLRRLAEKPHDGLQGMPRVGLDRRIEIVRDGQVGTECECAVKSPLRGFQVMRSRLAELLEEAVAASQSRPGGSVVRVFLEALAVEVARHGPALEVVLALEMSAAQIEFIRSGG